MNDIAADGEDEVRGATTAEPQPRIADGATDTDLAAVSAVADGDIGRPLNEIDQQITEDMKHDRDLRGKVATIVFRILGFQLVATNVIVFLSGLREPWLYYFPPLRFEQWGLQIYTGATIIEVMGIAAVVVHYLFPRRDNHQK